MKTIKQIADELGVSKQAVRDKIAKLGLQSTLQKTGNSFAIPKVTENALKSEFIKNKTQSKSETETQSNFAINEKLIAMLEAELFTKNRQIEELNARLAEAMAVINNEQLLHGGTIQQQLTVGETNTAEKENLVDNKNEKIIKSNNWIKKLFKYKIKE